MTEPTQETQKKCTCIPLSSPDYDGSQCDHCNRMEQQWRLEAEQEREWKRSRRIERKLECIPPRYRDLELWALTPRDSGQEAAVKACKEYASAWQRQQGMGLYLTSRKGRGKTMLACLLLKRLIEWSDISAEFHTVADLLHGLRYLERGEACDLMESCRTTNLLFLDDVGAGEKYTDFAVEQLYLVLNHRYNQCLPVVVTSNLPLNAPQGQPTVGSVIGERLESRLREICKQVVIPGDDLRGRKAA